MQILRTILTILFVIDCIALTVVVLMQKVSHRVLVRLPELQTHTGVRTKDVPWRAVLLRQLQLWEFCSLYWQLY